MSTLLVWKDQIEKIYARYSFYIVKILQFVLGLCVFGLINSNICLLYTSDAADEL